MNDYKLIERISDELIRLSSKYGDQIFALVKIRKARKCVETGIEIAKGNYAYRPITNGYNRMHRISIVGMKLICES